MFNNQSYDEYIRSILGYDQVNHMDSIYQRDFQDFSPYDRNYSLINTSMSNDELEDCYPEIYKVVYPMVQKACATNTRPLTRELVDDLTNEIYMSIEGNNEVQININLQNQTSQRNTPSNNNISDTLQNKSDAKVNEREADRETRQFNRGLSDIIRILLLRELLGRPGFFEPRPPRPQMRPPFPPPGRPPMRPPYNRELNDIYEY